MGAALWDGSVEAQFATQSRHDAGARLSRDVDAELRVNFLSTGNRFGRRAPDELLASERAERGDADEEEEAEVVESGGGGGDGLSGSGGGNVLLPLDRQKRARKKVRAQRARRWARAITERGHELESHVEISVEGSEVCVVCVCVLALSLFYLLFSALLPRGRFFLSFISLLSFCSLRPHTFSLKFCNKLLSLCPLCTLCSSVTLELSLGAIDALIRVHGGVIAERNHSASDADGDAAPPQPLPEGVFESFSQKRYPLSVLLEAAFAARP